MKTKTTMENQNIINKFGINLLLSHYTMKYIYETNF